MSQSIFRQRITRHNLLLIIPLAKSRNCRCHTHDTQVHTVKIRVNCSMHLKKFINSRRTFEKIFAGVKICFYCDLPAAPAIHRLDVIRSLINTNNLNNLNTVYEHIKLFGKFYYSTRVFRRTIILIIIIILHNIGALNKIRVVAIVGYNLK